MNDKMQTIEFAELKHYVQVGKQGGSLRVTIPQDIVEELGLEDGDRLRSVVGDDFAGFRRD